MDMSAIAARLGLSGSRPVVRKAAELRRLCDINFDSSVLGIMRIPHRPSNRLLSLDLSVVRVSDAGFAQGEACKAIICLEIAATKFQVIFDRSEAVRVSGMSEKAYIRSFNEPQNGLGVKTTLDVRELGIQFGCVRLIPFVQKGLVLYKERFLAALPPSRRSSTDFGRSEFTTVSTSMGDLCFDVLGIAKEKKDPISIKGNRELLDVLPSKRKHEDDSDHSDESSGDDNDDELDLPTHKRHKKMEKQAYNQWKSSVISTSKQTKPDPTKPRKQAQLNFKKKLPDAALEVPPPAS